MKPSQIPTIILAVCEVSSDDMEIFEFVFKRCLFMFSLCSLSFHWRSIGGYYSTACQCILLHFPLFLANCLLGDSRRFSPPGGSWSNLHRRLTAAFQIRTSLLQPATLLYTGICNTRDGEEKGGKRRIENNRPK